MDEFLGGGGEILDFNAGVMREVGAEKWTVIIRRGVRRYQG